MAPKVSIEIDLAVSTPLERLTIQIDPLIPAGEVHFKSPDGRTLGKIVNTGERRRPNWDRTHPYEPDDDGCKICGEGVCHYLHWEPTAYNCPLCGSEIEAVKDDRARCVDTNCPGRRGLIFTADPEGIPFIAEGEL